MNVIAIVLLAAVSAFSAFPSPFYAGIAESVGGGLWAPAVLFSSHGAAVIAAMSVLARRRETRLSGAQLLALALAVDAAGGLLLAWGMADIAVAPLLAGRVVTGIALGIATPLLTEVLSRQHHGTAWATAGTLGGVGLGALAAALLAQTVASPAWVFLAGSAALGAAALVAGRQATFAPSSSPARPAATLAARMDGASAVALAVVFTANGTLGLFTSVVPAAVVASVGGGALLAGTVVATTMLGAGLARLVARRPSGAAVAVTAATSSGVGLTLFTAGVAAHQGPAVILGSVLLGAGCGIAYDIALRMAIGSKVDALRRVSALARVQRAGQLGLVLPALAFPLFL